MTRSEVLRLLRRHNATLARRFGVIRPLVVGKPPANVFRGVKAGRFDEHDLCFAV